MILSFDVSNDFLDILFEVSHTVLTTNGEGEPGAATARRKLEPDGGSPNKYGCRIAGSLWERKGTRSTGKGVR